MSAFTQLVPKEEIQITDKWDLGEIGLERLLPDICSAMSEAITNSFRDEPPDIWLRPAEDDALSIDLALPALGEPCGDCPEFRTSIAELIRNECKDFEEDDDIERVDHMQRVAMALRELSFGVLKSIARWESKHPETTK